MTLHRFEDIATKMQCKWLAVLEDSWLTGSPSVLDRQWHYKPRVLSIIHMWTYRT